VTGGQTDTSMADSHTRDELLKEKKICREKLSFITEKKKFGSEKNYQNANFSLQFTTDFSLQK